MTSIIVALFNSVRPSLIGAHRTLCADRHHGDPCTGPDAIRLYGCADAMRLTGLMFKNSIVLLDEIEANKAAVMSPCAGFQKRRGGVSKTSGRVIPINVR